MSLGNKERGEQEGSERDLPFLLTPEVEPKRVERTLLESNEQCLGSAR